MSDATTKVPRGNEREFRRSRSRRRWRLGAMMVALLCLVYIVVLVMWGLNRSRSAQAVAMLAVHGAFAGGTLVLALVYLRGHHERPRISRRQGGQEVRLTLPAFAALGMMIILLIGSLIGRSNPLMLVAAMISGPFVVNGWLAHVILRRIHLHRRVPERTTAGEAVWVELELTNDKRWFATWLTTVRDEITSDDESLDAEVVFTRTPPRSTSRGRYQLRPMRRGRYVLGPIVVRTSFPIGFVERSQRFEEQSELLVRPRLGRLSAQWRRSRPRNEAQIRVNAQRSGGVDDEFQQLREHRYGDGMRKIHWRTSARRNELMVRDDRQAHAPPYTLLVDLWQPADPEEADLDRIELAVGFVATLCVDQLTRNRDGELRIGVAGAESKSWIGRSGPAGIEALLDEFAVVSASHEADFAGVADEVLTAIGPRSSVVLVTTRPLDELNEIVEKLPQEARRRLVDVRIVEATPSSLEPLFSYDPSPGFAERPAVASARDGGAER